MSVRVAVAGATGKTGSQIARCIADAPGLELVGALGSPRTAGRNLGTVLGTSGLQARIFGDLTELQRECRPDVLVDFTIAEVARNNIFAAVDHGIRAVVGTTGLPPAVISEFADHCRARGIGAAVIPNFSIGAMLMMRWAREAARYFPDVEIIEMHHAAKLDKPSGTALRIARRISEATDRDGQRDIPIHSVRLPGLMAHHQIVFGAGGQTVKISHDAMDRSCYCSGVILAARKVLGLNRAVFDLEDLLESNDDR